MLVSHRHTALNTFAPMEMSQLWPSAVQAQQVIYSAYAPALWQTGKAAGLSGTTAEWLVFILGNFDVAPISAQLLWLRLPYASPQVYEIMLANLVDAGFLTANNSGEYRFTDSARKIGWRLFTAKHAHLATVEVMPSIRLERLASLLHRVVHASRVAPRPVVKRWLTSRCTYLAQNATPLAQITEYLDDLSAHRDDCYLAAWQEHNIDGGIWEAFSPLWWQETLSRTGLTERLNMRGYTENDHMAVLQELSQRGWVEATVNAAGDWTIHHLTALGRTARSKMEELMDATFYAPWTVLHPQEVNELQELLAKLASHRHRQPLSGTCDC